jgi:hypothetical protein
LDHNWVWATNWKQQLDYELDNEVYDEQFVLSIQQGRRYEEEGVPLLAYAS